MYNEYYLQEINNKMTINNNKLESIIEKQENIIKNQEINNNTLCACEMILGIMLIFLFIIRSLN